ncbi:MAG: sensor domain-containing diguanylate cyclase [Desulfurivibrio sp.]|nr:sensor domain-containing diguanylate cyclase [Desulfurivibrio sp.]
MGEFGQIDELLERILDLMAGLVPGPVDCGIFLIQNENMPLAAARGASPAFRAAHVDMRVGTCLCGMVAQSGEVHVDEKGTDDPRHTIIHPGMEPHGHIIVPLQSKEGTVGVFYYHLPPGNQMPPRKQSLLKDIGVLLGMAITNARRYEEKRAEAGHDALTGLANRRQLSLELARHWATAQRENSSLAVIMLDLDHFKHYNDTRGHLAGDRLLREIGQIIRDCVRSEDLPVRYGGEEFLILLRRAGDARAEAVAERLREAVAARTEVTTSLGVAGSNPQDQDPWQMIQRADEALYQAKQQGRNRIQIHS